MAIQVHDIKCPNCGAAQTPSNSECEYCKQPIVITTFTSVANMPMPLLNKYVRGYNENLQNDANQSSMQFSLGMCYLKLKIYDKARAAFERAFEENFDHADAYFYAAICILGGRKPFLCMRPEIDKIEEYINAAISIETKAIYYYFLSYIKYDYFSRKFFRTSPTHDEALSLARSTGISPADIGQFFQILSVERPACL